MNKIGIIILAAGSSSRLGKPKQLLPYNNITLLEHIISQATDASSAVFVVLGANQDVIHEKIKNSPVRIVFNNDWEDGMSSSIHCGLSELLKTDSPDAIIIMASDQPFVTGHLLKEMIDKYTQTNKPIVACSYEHTLGVPVLFDKKFYGALLEMDGQTGAKKIINENLNFVESVYFHMGQIDIDTSADYETFKKIHLPK